MTKHENVMFSSDEETNVCIFIYVAFEDRGLVCLSTWIAEVPKPLPGCALVGSFRALLCSAAFTPVNLSGATAELRR